MERSERTRKKTINICIKLQVGWSERRIDYGSACSVCRHRDLCVSHRPRSCLANFCANSVIWNLNKLRFRPCRMLTMGSQRWWAATEGGRQKDEEKEPPTRTVTAEHLEPTHKKLKFRVRFPIPRIHQHISAVLIYAEHITCNAFTHSSKFIMLVINLWPFSVYLATLFSKYIIIRIKQNRKRSAAQTFFVPQNLFNRYHFVWVIDVRGPCLHFELSHARWTHIYNIYLFEWYNWAKGEENTQESGKDAENWRERDGKLNHGYTCVAHY